MLSDKSGRKYTKKRKYAKKRKYTKKRKKLIGGSSLPGIVDAARFDTSHDQKVHSHTRPADDPSLNEIIQRIVILCTNVVFMEELERLLYNHESSSTVATDDGPDESGGSGGSGGSDVSDVSGVSGDQLSRTTSAPIDVPAIAVQPHSDF